MPGRSTAHSSSHLRDVGSATPDSASRIAPDHVAGCPLDVLLLQILQTSTNVSLTLSLPLCLSLSLPPPTNQARLCANTKLVQNYDKRYIKQEMSQKRSVKSRLIMKLVVIWG